MSASISTETVVKKTEKFTGRNYEENFSFYPCPAVHSLYRRGTCRLPAAATYGQY